MIDLKVPTPGESITEVEIVAWLVSDGDLVRKDQELAEIESDKATLMLSAPESGKILIKLPAGETVSVGEIACQIDTSVSVPESSQAKTTAPAGVKETDSGKVLAEGEDSSSPDVAVESAPEKVDNRLDVADSSNKAPEGAGAESVFPDVKMTPLAREKMKAAGLSVDDVINGLKKVTSGDIDMLLSASSEASTLPKAPTGRTQERKKMSQLRKKLSQRLVKVKNETAMLTTFNEVDMSEIMAVRKSYQESFVKKHGFKLGFMSFFIKASAIALKGRPMVNSMMDGEEIVTPGYVDVSIAVQTPKGLMVPVVRDVQALSLAAIELQLSTLAAKARSGKISLEEMTGGTFTITNGGIFGSLLSTPLINPPQSAIMGMHNIVERPVAIKGQVEVRPMMYLALSYDHRLIDGKDSVGFLMDVKKMLEDPRLLLSDGADPMTQLLDL